MASDLTKLLASPADLSAIYAAAHKALPAGNQCALTASLALKRAKMLTTTYNLTGDLDKALKGKGWVIVTSPHALVKGDVCFSCDWQGLKMPDHVYLFSSYATKGKVAVVYDNYSQGLHERNLINGLRTPFAYALRPPE